MALTTLPTRLDGPLLLEPKRFGDDRGFFAETYRRSEFSALGIAEEFIQDNHSRSAYGVIRGMHFQIGRGASKLVRCGRGSIVDVAVDLRRGSPTFGEWEAYELDEDNGRIAYIPIGFAHGFCVRSEIADVLYKQDSYYEPDTDRGIRYDDPAVGIEWPIPEAERIVSERDAAASTLADIAAELPFEYAGSP